MLVLHHPDRLIGEVLGEVVSVLGPARRVDVVVVAHEVRGPLVGVTSEEPVVPLEADAERPVVERSGRGELVARCEVPLANGQCVVPAVTQDARQRRCTLRDRAGVTGKGHRHVGKEPHADGVVVASCHETGASGRAQRGHVEPVVTQAVRGEAVDVRRLDA